MENDNNPFLDPQWTKIRRKTLSPLPLINLHELIDGMEDDEDEPLLGAVGGAPRHYPRPSLTDDNRPSDFAPGGPLANQIGQTLQAQGDEIFVMAEIQRLRQQAKKEHDLMLAAQEEALQVTSAVCNENDILRAKLQQLGIDPNSELGLKSTPGTQGKSANAKRTIQFPEKEVEQFKQQPKANPKISDKNFTKNPPKQNLLSQNKKLKSNQSREDVNAFTASGGTEYKKLPPVHPPISNWQQTNRNPLDNSRVNARTHLNQYKKSPSRGGNSEEGIFGAGPRFSSTQRQSDGQPHNSRIPQIGRTTHFQSPLNTRDNRQYNRRNQREHDHNQETDSSDGRNECPENQSDEELNGQEDTRNYRQRSTSNSRERRSRNNQTFAPYGRDTRGRFHSRDRDPETDNLSVDEEDEYSRPPRLTRPQSYRTGRSRRQTNNDFDDQDQSTDEDEELLPLSVTARYVDPSKLIRSYEGRMDHRTPVGFIREFEQYTSNIHDKIRGKIFVSRLNTAKFRMARSYKHSLGYQKLKEQFLASEWGEAAREEAIRRIDTLKYDPVKYATRAEFLVAIYEQLYDCRISIRSLFDKIMRHCPFYSGVLSEKDCRFFDGFAAKVQALQARFGDHVNNPNLGFKFCDTTSGTSVSNTSRTLAAGKSGTFMIQQPMFEDIQSPHVMQVGEGIQSTQQNEEAQSFEYPGNALWH